MSAYLDGLRASLRYTSGAARREIQALIDAETNKSFQGSDIAEPAAPQNPVPAARSDSRSGPEGSSVGGREPLPSELPESGRAPQGPAAAAFNPARAAVVEPEPKPPEPEALGSPHRAGAEGAGSSSETKARQSGGCGSAVPQCPVEEPTGKPVSHGEAGGNPATIVPASRVRGASRWVEKICPTCQKPFTTPWPAKLYCGGYCQTTRPYSHVGADRLCACGAVFKPRGSNQRSCSACRGSARPLRASKVTAPAKPATEPKQAPRRPPWRLGWDPTIKIMPPRPAPVRLYSNGVPTPFQDDLAAITDCGSPWAMMRTPALGQARLSPLAGAI